jgi:ABC-type glycerol-3-phosphate transport system substrate-binding protein
LSHHHFQAAATLAFATALGLTACSGLPGSQTGASHKVELDGLNYRVEQITASTWTATPPPGLAEAKLKAASLVQAIEKASGCRVTDSSVGQQGAVLNAQVDCGSRLKN